MKAIELFAGAGGLGMGISKAGFKPIQIIEWDRWCCDTINENRRSGAEKLVRHWPKAPRTTHGPVSVMMACIATRHAGCSERRHLAVLWTPHA